MPAEPRESYFARASPQFQAAFEGVHRKVKARFPQAEPAFAFQMPGWRVPIPIEKQPPPMGTMPPDAVTILLADRKGGPTLHLWNPLDHAGLQKHKKDLEAAGFKVMVGCLEFRKKADYPVQAVDKLFVAIARSLM